MSFYGVLSVAARILPAVEEQAAAWRDVRDNDTYHYWFYRVTAAAEKQRVWDLHAATPPPLGFDPQPHYGSIHHRYFGVLCITPWRIELGNLGGEALIWRARHEP